MLRAGRPAVVGVASDTAISPPTTARHGSVTWRLRTWYRRPSLITSMLPSRSVLWTRSPGMACRWSRVAWCGWPNAFPIPAEMSAAPGLVASSNGGLLLNFEP